MKDNTLKTLLNQRNYFFLNKILIRIIGLLETVILGEFIDCYDYYDKHNQLQDGYFFYTYNSLYEHLNIKEDTARKAIKHMEELGIIQIKKMGIPCKSYYKIEDDIIEKIINKKDIKTVGKKEKESKQTKAIETINFIKKDLIALKTKINSFIDKVKNVILNKNKFGKIIKDRISKGINQFWDLEYLSLYKLSEDNFVSFNKTSFAASLWKQGLKKELSDKQMTTIFTLLKAYKYGE